MITLMPINDINKVLKSLRDAHIDEVAFDTISVNKEVYDKCYKYAFIKDNEQIGYIAYIIQRHPHYDKKVFQDVSYFIAKKHRRSAKQIFNLIKKQAKSQNCEMMLIHCKTEAQTKFFEAINYELSDYVMRANI